MKTIQFHGQRNIISRQLARARKNEHMSQARLAARLQAMGVHIDQQGISKIERNRRIVADYELLCLCDVLGVQPTSLLSDVRKEA